MKLKTKLTAICAALLFLVAIALSGAMLWQVREQSYKTLTQRSEEKLAGLGRSFQRGCHLPGQRADAGAWF